MGRKACSRAAEQGIARAQSNLGMLYAKGRGVEQDYTGHGGSGQHAD